MLISAIHQQESAIGIHMPPQPQNLPPTSHPTRPSRWPQSPGCELPASCSKFPPAIYFAYGNIHISVLLSLLVPPSPSPQSVLYIRVSTASVQIGSSVPSFKIPYIWVNLWYFFLFLTFSSCLSIISSRFIYLIRTDSNMFFFLWPSNAALYVWTTAALSTHLSMDIGVASTC